ncbi:MAG TPA: PAS domain S-box protein [Chroococcales cyanobacterium]
MVTATRSHMQCYGIAVLAVVLAMLLMLLVNPWVTMSQSPFLMFFGAVMVSAWYGGMAAGLLSTFSSALLSTYFLIEPTYSLKFDFSDGVRLSLFVLEGILISALCEALHMTNRRLDMNVQKRQASEEALRKREQQFRIAMEHFPDPFAIYDANRRIQFVNTQALKLTRKSLEEFLGHTDEEIWPNEMTQGYLPLLRHAVETRTLQTQECTIALPDIGNLTMIVKYVPVLDERGEIDAILGITYDITARKQIEEALKASEVRFRSVVESNMLGIGFWEGDGKITDANEALLEMIGYTREEFLSGNICWQDLTPPEYYPLDEQAFAQTIASGYCTPYEKEYIRKDGSRFPIVLGGGHFEGCTNKGAFFVLDITERKRAEEALRESQQLFQSFMNNTPMTAFIKDEAGRYIYVNQRAEYLFNQQLTDWIGKTDFDLFSAEAAKQWREHDLTVLKTGKTVKVLETAPLEDGEHHYMSYKFRIQSTSGQEFVAGMSLDITDRKRLEDELRQSEARFRRLVESNIIGVFFPNLEGNISDANDAFLNMVGYEREDLHQGKVDWKAMSPPDYRELDKCKVEELKVSGVCIPFEKEYVRKDGRRIPILIGAALLEGSEQNTIAFAVDLSDRDRALEALKESEERFRHMADTAPVLIWMSGTDKLCNYFNQPWLDFTGRTMEQELGNGWAEGVHPDDLPYCLDTYVNAFEARRDFQREYRLRRCDGEYRWVFGTGIPRFTPEGSFLGYIGSCIDISDRYQAEAEIRQLNESLEQRVKQRTAELEFANRELESFSYSVSHDLRAPLRHISGFVNLLQKRATSSLDETSQRYLNIITQSTKQAEKLVDDLLAFSRMGRTQMCYKTIDMLQLVKEVQRDLEQETKGRTIHWQVGELPSVQGDPSLLRQVLRNLMENAVKYTAKRVEAEIEIGSRESDRDVVFFVRDNGVGFDMRYAHKLFGVFQRLHSPQDFEGTGIGLANVQRVIQRHGGKTWAEGVVDGGATFYLSLPKLPQEGLTVECSIMKCKF